MHVFIDTNILLNFFHFTKEEVDLLNDVFASHKHGSARVHLTRQVQDEFLRNRGNKIKDALKKFHEAKYTAQLPSFMKAYEEFEIIRSKCSELEKLKKAIAERVDKDIRDRNLLADHLIEDIFSKAELLETTDQLFDIAHRRMLLGNPPGKNNSMGDAVNWTTLLFFVPPDQDLHVISEDGDFYSVLDENAPHPFLEKEWMDKKKGKLRVYRTLSSFMKEHFDGTSFSFDKDKDALIESLYQVNSFAGTHNIISKLEQYSYFSLKEVERILSAAVANNQFGRIVSDQDVSDFLRRAALPRLPNLTEQAQIDILKSIFDEM